jgi:hypothetical protein
MWSREKIRKYKTFFVFTGVSYGGTGSTFNMEQPLKGANQIAPKPTPKLWN